MGQSEWFSGRLLGPLLKTDLLLMKNVLTPLAKSVLIPSGLTAAASATDATIQKENFVSGMATLIISRKAINDIMKIVKSLEESGLLTKGVNESIKNEKYVKRKISWDIIRYIRCEFITKSINR